MDKQRLRNVLGGVPVEDAALADNLAIALCKYSSDHRDRPKDDPDTEHGWGEASATAAAPIAAR